VLPIIGIGAPNHAWADDRLGLVLCFAICDRYCDDRSLGDLGLIMALLKPKTGFQKEACFFVKPLLGRGCFCAFQITLDHKEILFTDALDHIQQGFHR